MIKFFLTKVLPLPLLLLICCTVFAQEKAISTGLLKKITGVVTDADGKPVQGATVGIKGTNTNVITDENGAFSINVPSEKSVLKISNVGLGYQEMVVGAKTVFSIKC